MLRLLVAAGCLVVGCLQPALSASFDCAHATEQLENTICGTPELNGLDDKQFSLYSAAKKKAPDPKTLVDEQRAWIAKLRDCGGNIECIRNGYASRIEQLSPIVDGAQAPNGRESTRPDVVSPENEGHALPAEDAQAFKESESGAAPKTGNSPDFYQTMPADTPTGEAAVETPSLPNASFSGFLINLLALIFILAVGFSIIRGIIRGARGGDFDAEKSKFINDLASSLKKSVKKKKSKFNFQDGVGFGVHPDRLVISWEVGSSELFKLQQQSEHIRDEADLKKLKRRLSSRAIEAIGAIGAILSFSKKSDDVILSRESVVFSLDSESLNIGAISRLEVQEHREVTRSRKETVEYSTTGGVVENAFRVGAASVNAVRSKTVAETKVRAEQGFLVVTLAVKLVDGRAFEASQKFWYSGSVAGDDYSDLSRVVEFTRSCIS